LILGAIFVKSMHIQQFCEGIHTFCPNFHRFCPDFHQSKSFRGALAPPPPTPVVGDATQMDVHRKANVQCYGSSCIQCFPCKKSLHWVE